MALEHYKEGIERRVTRDVDALYGSSAVVEQIADELRQEWGLPTAWLNDKVKMFAPAHGMPPGSLLVERGGVRIEACSARSMLARKLRAARLGRDEDDIAVLLRRCDVRTLAEARDVLDEFYDGEEAVKPEAELITSDALGEYQLRGTSASRSAPNLDEVDAVDPDRVDELPVVGQVLVPGRVALAGQDVGHHVVAGLALRRAFVARDGLTLR